MELQNFFAQDVNGNIVPGAVCSLFLPGTTTLATGLQDINNVPMGNPFNADANALVQFRAPNGVYDLHIAAGALSNTLQITCADNLQALAELASFLGTHPTAPTVRTDSTPLQLGDRYFNSGDDLEYLYKSTGWEPNNLDGALIAAPGGAALVGAYLPDGSAGDAQEALNIFATERFNTVAEFLTADVSPHVDAVRVLGFHDIGDGGEHLKLRIPTPSPVEAWHAQSADGAWWQIKMDRITIVMFGGKRTYAFDSRQALIDALDYAQQFNASFDEIGVYGIVGSVEIADKPTAFKGRGAVAKMHYQTFDDKRWMRRGTDTDGVLFKDKLPGAALIFKNGGPVATYTLANRTDDYATVKPCITLSSNSNELINFAVIQDNDCFDEDGNFTPLYDQNTATDFDMGIFNRDSPRNLQEDMTVWGYFNKSGTTIWSQPGNDDPDGNIIRGGMYSGRHGLSLLGASAPSSQAQGLSGTMLYSPTLGSKDNNSRVANVGGLTVADYYVNADAENWRCLYIDGDVSVNTADLAGQFLSNVILRTSVNHPVELGYCSSVKFFGGINESGNYGVPGSNTTKWLANTNTGAGVVIDEMRVADLGIFFHPEFAGRIPFRISGGVAGNSSAIYSKVDPNIAGGYSAMKVGIGRGVGDAGIQFTTDLASENNGFAFGYDVSDGSVKLWKAGVEVFSASAQGAFAPKLTAPQTGPVLTISSGSITPTYQSHVINGEGGVADDLVTIASGVTDRQILELRIGNATVTVKHATGNIRCGSDRVLNSSLDRISFQWAAGSAVWVLTGFTDNG